MDVFEVREMFAPADQLFAEGKNAEAASEYLRAFTGDAEMAALLKEKLQACYSALWKGLPSDPDLDASDYVALGHLHIKADRQERAIGLLAKAAGLRPNGGEVHLALGEAHFLQAFEMEDRKPSFDKAIDHLSAAVLFGFDDATPEKMGELHYFVGASHFFRDELPEAIENLQVAVQLNPGKAEAWFFMGSAAKSQGRFEEAASSLEKACAIAPDAYNLQQLGNCYQELGRTEDALGKLREALELRPDLVDLRRDIGVALMQKAEQEFDREVIATPDREWTLADFLAKPEVEQSIEELRLFVEKAKTMPDKATRDKVRLLRGTAARSLPTDRLDVKSKKSRSAGFSFFGFGPGAERLTIKDDIVRDPLASDMKAARERMELFRGAGEQSPRDCSDLGLTWFHRKLYGAARVAFQEALHKDATLAEVHQYIAAAWSHLGNDERSASHMEEAIRLGAQLFEPHRDLGLFHLHRGAEALPPLDDGTLDPELRKTLDLLRATRRSGEREVAIEHFRAYLRLAPEDEFTSFLRKLVDTYEGKDSTLENVYTLAAHEALQKEAWALAERLWEDFLTLAAPESSAAGRQRLEEVRRIKKTAARIHHEKANLFWATGQAERGINEWQEALRLDPEQEATQYNLGMALYESGRTGEALGPIEKFLALRSQKDRPQPEFNPSSPGALERKLSEGALKEVEQEATVLLIKLQTLQGF